ncbi:hypothetical protein swp_4861 [Shewanella piezotolerans WP3]|uniref:Uncharacterized protein n=1 Tax=Shewanella piezotolerans (strain WP3 / JCM 13877) TaxID=225849 RepID=B8CV07_SHEPW|nr:hypothetical protein swp_4861 [Shewanella piezotolerans WP3]
MMIITILFNNLIMKQLLIYDVKGRFYSLAASHQHIKTAILS